MSKLEQAIAEYNRAMEAHSALMAAGGYTGIGQRATPEQIADRQRQLAESRATRNRARQAVMEAMGA